MKRSEFLKRLGLGAVAAVAAPALLAKEEKLIDESNPYDKFLEDFKNQEPIDFKASVATPAYTFDIPPLKEGEHKYELIIDDKPILSGNIKAE